MSYCEPNRSSCVGMCARLLCGFVAAQQSLISKELNSHSLWSLSPLNEQPYMKLHICYALIASLKCWLTHTARFVSCSYSLALCSLFCCFIFSFIRWFRIISKSIMVDAFFFFRSTHKTDGWNCPAIYSGEK